MRVGSSDGLDRVERSIMSEVLDISERVLDAYLDLFEHRSYSDFKALLSEVGADKFRAGDAALDRLTAKYQDATFSVEGLEQIGLAFCKAAVGFCFDASRADGPSNGSVAWTYLIDAERSLARVEAIVVARSDEKKRAEGNRKRLDARHAENHAMRKDAIEWFRANRGDGLTKDAAAEQIAGKVVPMKFRTVRDWLTQVKD